LDGIHFRIIETASDGVLVLQIEKPDRGTLKPLVIEYFTKARNSAKSSNKTKPDKSDLPMMVMDLKYFRKKRNLDQNALYWALVDVLAFEVYRDHDEKWKAMLHEELLQMYAPRLIGKLIKREVIVRSSEMNTVEFSRLVEGTFHELAVNGIEVTEPADIGRYWRDWQIWRSQQEVDPLRGSYQNVMDYRRRVNFCEACLKYLGGEERGSMAHIISRGAGGVDEDWNYLRLCDTCHTGIGGVEYDQVMFDKVVAQHKVGWHEFLERNSHLLWKVDRAMKHAEPMRNVTPEPLHIEADPKELELF
jgi:hypothetical protein